MPLARGIELRSAGRRSYGTAGYDLNIPREQAATIRWISGESSIEGVHFFRAMIGDKPYRVSTVADSETEAVSRIQGAALWLNGGPIAPKRLKAWRGRASSRQRGPARTASLAFVFPGQGSHYAGMAMNFIRPFRNPRMDESRSGSG